MYSVFLSYSHADETLKNALLVHLSSLRRQGLIGVWHDRALRAGEHLDANIEAQLKAADVVLLLVTADFIASDYCYEKEMVRAFERAQRDEVKLAAIIARPCHWHEVTLNDEKRLGDYLALPRDGKAVTTWPNADEAWTDVVKGIHGLLVELKRGPAGPKDERAQTVSARIPTGSVPSAQATKAERKSTTRTVDASDEGRSYRLKHSFTELEQEDFLERSFETICSELKSEAEAAREHNDWMDVRSSRQAADAFYVKVFVRGEAVGGVRINLGSVFHSGRRLTYSFDVDSSSGSINGWFGQAGDGNEQFFTSDSFGAPQNGREIRRLTARDVAQQLWGLVAKQVEARS